MSSGRGSYRCASGVPGRAGRAPAPRSTSCSRASSAAGGSVGLDHDRAVEEPAGSLVGPARRAAPRARSGRGARRRGIADPCMARSWSTARRRHSSRSPRFDPTDRNTRAMALYRRRRVSSTPGMPASPSIGGVSLRTRTRTSSQGNSREQHLREPSRQPLEQVHPLLRADLHDPARPPAVVHAWPADRPTRRPAPGRHPAPRRPRTRRPPSARPA